MSIATWNITCGHCSRKVAAEILFIEQAGPQNLRDPSFKIPNDKTLYLVCPSCRLGSVRSPYGSLTQSFQVFPGQLPGAEVGNLPADVATAWAEARRAHSVGAYTAAEIMCRKILMHLAVGVAGSTSGKKFVEYINDLEAGNFIMAGLKPVVAQIRDRGNKANHELPASTEKESLTTLTITQHLMSGIYELPALTSTSPAAGTSSSGTSSGSPNP